jgi:hypothetical protein
MRENNRGRRKLEALGGVEFPRMKEELDRKASVVLWFSFFTFYSQKGGEKVDKCCILI